MKFKELLTYIKDFSIAEPNVNTVFIGDVYELNEKQDIHYSAVVINGQSHNININQEYNTYGLNIFYVDRETSDKSNVDDIHSNGIDVLNNIINKIEVLGGDIINEVNIQTFEERFDSICAGAFATVNVRFENNICDKPNIVTSVNGMTGDVILKIEGVTEEELTEKLALKQDVIEDLENIREGANKGLSSVQPDDLESKQDTLVSGTNIKTVNGNSLLGSGNIEIQSGTNFLGKLGSYTTFLSAFLNALSVKGAVSNFEGISKDAAKVGDLFIIEAKAADTQDYYVFLLECETPKNNNLRGHTIYSYITHDYELLSNKITEITSTSTNTQYPSAKSVYDELQKKQDTLVSGTNIKTINNQSILGSGNITISTDDCEKLVNKVTQITSTSTDSQYPSAKAVYTQINNNISTIITALGDYAKTNWVIQNYQPRGNYATTTDLEGKQNTLVSGTNIKTVNGNSLLGSGNIEIKGNVIDNLTSTSTTDALSANMGRVLKDKIDEIELSKFPNVTIFGQPTIQQGQISNFSAVNYLQFPFIVDFQNRHWQIDMEVTMGAVVTGQHNILDSNFGLAFAIQNAKLVMAISHTGNAWDGAYTSSLSIEPNKTYRIKMYWDTNTYKVDVSDNNIDWVNYISVDNTNSLYPRTMIIGKSLDNRYIWNGSINFNYCTLTISDKVVWQGMDDAGLATRMAVNMNNIDDEGVEKIKEITGVESLSEHITELDSAIAFKQDNLISGQNIKTINNQSILGSGNMKLPSMEEYNRLKELLYLVNAKCVYSDFNDIKHASSGNMAAVISTVKESKIIHITGNMDGITDAAHWFEGTDTRVTPCEEIEEFDASQIQYFYATFNKAKVLLPQHLNCYNNKTFVGCFDGYKGVRLPSKIECGSLQIVNASNYQPMYNNGYRGDIDPWRYCFSNNNVFTNLPTFNGLRYSPSAGNGRFNTVSTITPTADEWKNFCEGLANPISGYNNFSFHTTVWNRIKSLSNFAQYKQIAVSKGWTFND